MISAILGIGETGSPSDAELLLPFLNEPSVNCRAAATRSLGALAKERYATVLLGMLQDSSKKVSGEALRALRANAPELELSELWKAFQSPLRHVRRALLDLMAEIDIWSTMPYLIEAATHVDSDTADHAQRIVQQSENRVFTRPDAQQREAINVRLSQVGHACPEFVKECRRLLNV